jgi:hypothetical protein
MDRLVQLLAPYRGWDPRTPSDQHVTRGGGRHAKPIAAVDDVGDPGTIYIRAGCRRASSAIDDATAEGRAV